MSRAKNAILSLLTLFLSTTALASDGFGSEYYRCYGYAMCRCIPSDQPGSGMTCDYLGRGEGGDPASAASAAKADALRDCEESCTRKTGNRCYNVSAGNCVLIRTLD